MTTNSTKEQLTELGNVIVDTATRLGTNVSNISQIAEVYANINETTESIAEKIQPAALLATSGEMTGSEASTILQSLKNQFDLTDDAAQHLVDSIEKISASIKMDFSTGIRNIASAVEEAGSLAKEAGEDFETFAAQVSVITENTGESGDTVGASLKQQFARISRANSGDVTAEEISAADKALQSIGIHVRDANGEFKDISETLTELYHKWDNLTSVEKSYVAEQIAGTRRKNDFIVLMNNYNEVLDLATQAENSNGFALETNAKRLESIQAKTEAFNASVIRLWTTLINSDAIKTTVDLGTNLVNVFTKLNQTIGAFPPLMGAVAAALSGFKNIGMIYA
jgi:TP901 family phage tail tape measure protein